MKKILSLLFLVAITVTLSAQTGTGSVHDLFMKHRPLYKEHVHGVGAMKQNAERSGIVVPAPLINFSGNQAITVHRNLHNTTDTAVSFYFTQLFRNDQEFIDYLRGKISNLNDTALAQRELISALFDVTKYYFSNNTLIFDWQGSSAVFKKEMSFMGFLYSMHNAQCGNFFRHAITILIATHYFTLADFETIDVPGHSIGQIMNMNKPIFSDFDAGTGFSWDKNPSSPNGYADIDEIRQDTFLISDYYTRNGKVLVDTTNPYHLRSNYRRLLTGNPMQRGPLYGYVSPLQITSEVILPAHSDVTTQLGAVLLVFDMHDSTSFKRISNLKDTLQPIYQAGGCTWCIDSFLTVVAQEFRVDKSILTVQSLDFGMYNSATDQGKTFGELLAYEYERDAPPVWDITGSNIDTIVLGRDFKLPFLLLNTENISGAAQIGDTSFVSPAVFHLWDAGSSSPLVISSEVNYVQTGFIPPSQNWNVKVAVNAHPGMLSLFEEWGMNGDLVNNLTFETVVDLLSDQTTSIARDPQLFQWTMYPNPVKGSVVVVLPQAIDKITVCNTLGQPVMYFYSGSNNIETLVSGIYFVAGKKLVVL